MKKILISSIVVLGLGSAFSALAEPMSFDQLSFRQDRSGVERSDVTRIVHPVGHGKYRHHQTPLEAPVADTEIAAFEEVGSDKGYTRHLRMDRIPR